MEFYLWPFRFAVRGLPGLMLGVIVGRTGISVAFGPFLLEIDVQ